MEASGMGQWNGVVTADIPNIVSVAEPQRQPAVATLARRTFARRPLRSDWRTPVNSCHAGYCFCRVAPRMQGDWISLK